MSSSLDVTVAGLAVVDLLGRPVDLRRPPRPGGLQLIDSITLATGGNVPNFCIDLAKLGFRAGAITRVGDDGFGEFISHQLSLHGVATDGVIVDRTRQTSTTFVAIRKDGERSFLHTRGCIARFRAKDVLKQIGMIARSRLFAMGYLGLLPECEPEFPLLFRAIKERTRARILLDTGGAPRRATRLLRAFLPYVDFFIPSEEEAVAVTGRQRPEEITRFLFDAGAPFVTGVKLGVRGCYIALAGGGGAYIPARRVRRVVDATGAGDAFVSGFMAGILKGRDPFEAARIGNAVAASCVTAVGASTAIQPFTTYLGR